MMRDQPQSADLLAEAKRVLIDNVLPTLSSKTRYQTLMVIRAITLAENELHADSDIEVSLGDQLSQLVADEGTVLELSGSLAMRIRAGDFDASEDAHSFLQLVTAYKLRETNPAKISGGLEDALEQGHGK